MIALVQKAAEEQNPLVPPLPELVIGLIAFAIVFFFLWKKLLPNINKVLDERREAIEGGIEQAEAAQAEAAEVLKQYKDQLAEARHEAARHALARRRSRAPRSSRRCVRRASASARRSSPPATPRSRPTASRPRWHCVRTWASSPPTWPASSSGSPSRTHARQSRTIDRFLDDLEEKAEAAR